MAVLRSHCSGDEDKGRGEVQIFKQHCRYMQRYGRLLLSGVRHTMQGATAGVFSLTAQGHGRTVRHRGGHFRPGSPQDIVAHTQCTQCTHDSNVHHNNNLPHDCSTNRRFHLPFLMYVAGLTFSSCPPVPAPGQPVSTDTQARGDWRRQHSTSTK